MSIEYERASSILSHKQKNNINNRTWLLCLVNLMQSLSNEFPYFSLQIYSEVKSQCLVVSVEAASVYLMVKRWKHRTGGLFELAAWRWELVVGVPMINVLATRLGRRLAGNRRDRQPGEGVTGGWWAMASSRRPAGRANESVKLANSRNVSV